MRTSAWLILLALPTALCAAGETIDDLGAVRVMRLDMSEVADQVIPTRDDHWESVGLPHRWGAEVGPEGRTVWYRMTLQVANPSRGDLAVYLPKVSMNADLWVGAHLAARIGTMSEPLTRHWNTPLLFRIPAVALQPGVNELLIRVRAHARHDGGLAPLWVGSAALLEPMADRAEFWRVTFVNMLIAYMLALAFVVVIVWVRRPDRLDYLYFSLGAVGCAISSLNMTVDKPPIGDDGWETLVHIALHGGVICLALFGWEFAGVSTKRLRWVAAIVVLVDLGALLLLHGASHRFAVAVFSLLVIAAATAALVPFVLRLRHQPLTDFLMLGLAAVIAISFGLHDWLIVSGFSQYEAPFTLPYVWPILLSAFAWLIAGDYAKTQRELAALNRELGDRVRAREAALLQTHEQLREAERAQASAEERARILRDMHDGVGAHLATALRQLESDVPTKADVAHTLRDSLDHLKLSIDVMTVAPGDVNATLAALRYRLAPRLEAAGLRVVWNVDELPTWSAGRIEGRMHHLQFLLFEIVSNVLQHAGASTLSVAARADARAIEVTIADDGRGIAEGTVVRSCETRAQAIGATLDIRRRTPGTAVAIRLPDDR